MTARPCIECGVPTSETRCDECRGPLPSELRRGSARERGYTSAFDRLSRRARKAQPFCLDCGSPDNLTLDHLPEAWRRHYAGKAPRLEDYEVVCNDCNVARGSSRPGSQRAREDQGTAPAGKGRGPRAKAQGPLHTTGGSR